MTQFTDVYNRFLGKITDDMYVELTPEDTIKDLRRLLIDALPGFEFPRKNLQNYSIEEEIKAIESIEPTKVVGLSINLKNAKLDMDLDDFESRFDLPVEDVYNNGASKLLDAILDYLEE